MLDTNSVDFSATRFEKIGWFTVPVMEIAGPLMILITGIQIPVIVQRLNDESRLILPLWQVADILGPVILLSVVAGVSVRSKSSRFLVGWLFAAAALYLSWPLLAGALLRIEWYWNTGILALFFIALVLSMPSGDQLKNGYIVFLSNLFKNGTKSLYLWAFVVHWFCAICYGAVLLKAGPALLPSAGKWAYGFGILELFNSTFSRFLIVKAALRVG